MLKKSWYNNIKNKAAGGIVLNKLEIKTESYDDLDDQIIDVTEDCYYKYQTPSYNEDYKKWRSGNGNRFGFKFTNDSQEFAYMDGAGYIEDSPEKSERKTISSICSLFAVALILSFAMGIAVRLFMVYILKLNGSIIEWDIFSGCISCSEPDKILIIIVSGLFSFSVPIIMLMIILKLPLSIAAPKSNISKATFIYTIPLMMAFFVMSFYCYSFSNDIFQLIGFSNRSPMLFIPEDTRLLPSAILYYLIILPVMTEFLFSGIILQSLRQFGDEFAIIVTSIFSAIFVHNLLDSGYTFILSIIISFIAVRTGSLFSAVFSRSIFLSIYFFAVGIQKVLSPEDSKIVLSWTLFLMILWGFLLLKLLSVRHKSILNLRKHTSYCSIGKKYVSVFLSVAVLCFCVVSFVIQLFMLEFTKLL